MKKLLSLVLVLTMIFALSACSSDSDSSDSADSGSDGGTVYLIATDTTFAPFEYENEAGEMVGIDLDLLAAIAEDQGFEYELQVLGFSAAVTALESNQCDAVIAGMSITEAREEKYDFSDPYYESCVAMGVLSGSSISSFEDLAGLTVAAKTGTEGCTFAESIAEEYGFTVTQFTSSSNMYQDVLVGNSAACFEDYPVLCYEISRGMDMEVGALQEEGSSYGFATMKGANEELIEMFNAGLANLMESGEYDKIINAYITY